MSHFASLFFVFSFLIFWWVSLVKPHTKKSSHGVFGCIEVEHSGYLNKKLKLPIFSSHIVPGVCMQSTYIILWCFNSKNGISLNPQEPKIIFRNQITKNPSKWHFCRVWIESWGLRESKQSIKLSISILFYFLPLFHRFPYDFNFFFLFSISMSDDVEWMEGTYSV